jgi:hypothetical protein
MALLQPIPDKPHTGSPDDRPPAPVAVSVFARFAGNVSFVYHQRIRYGREILGFADSNKDKNAREE